MTAELETKNWYASHDFMPGSPPTFHLSGVVVCPTTGYKAELKPGSPQGINPAIYLFDLIVTPPAPGTVVSDVITDLPVRYEEDTETRYTHATIRPENITVEVEITS